MKMSDFSDALENPPGRCSNDMGKLSSLYILEDSGHAYCIKDGTLTQLAFIGIYLKKIASGNTALWAIGEDNLVYVFVSARGLPITVVEESYENQRWNPKDGFCDKLLPTDRCHFSSEDGLVDRTLDKISLPSLAWQWESDWTLSTRLGSVPLEAEGWTYALDFPRTYQPEKAWNSYVRRRKWQRRRCYVAVDTWAPVPNLNNSFTPDEPIIDIAVGGSAFEGKDRFFQSVWVVTITGKVAFRKGISEQSPEGTDWLIVPTPAGSEIAQISVGPAGIVWGVTWNGDALVRLGVDPYRPEGTGWLQVLSPGGSSLLANVSVGLRSVWATSRDFKVWYRKGIRAKASFSANVSLAGESWCEMTGEMSVVSMTPEDQIFSLGAQDRQIYFRSGISPSEPCGQSWIRLNFSRKKERAVSQTTIAEVDQLVNESELLNEPESSDAAAISDEIQSPLEEKDENIPEHVTASDSSQVQSLVQSQSDVFFDALSSSVDLSSSSSNDLLVKTIVSESETDSNPDSVAKEISIVLPKEDELPPPIELELTDNNFVSPLRRLSVTSSASTGISQSQFEHSWSSISASACNLDWENLPTWCLNRDEQIPVGPWRSVILEGLRDRMKTPVPKIENYENPVGKGSWLRTGRGSWHLDGIWQGCSLELEWWTDKMGIFVLFSRSKRLQVSLCDIIYSAIDFGFGRNHLCLYSKKSPKHPVRVSFNGDIETEEWVSYITYASRLFRNMSGYPGTEGIWALATRGDIFQSGCKEDDRKSEKEAVDLPIPNTPLPYAWSLNDGFAPGSTLSFVGTVPASSNRFSLDFLSGPGASRKEIAFHLNPRFVDDDYCLVRNSKFQDTWGQEERSGDFNVRKGNDILLDIECRIDCFLIYVNGKRFCSFVHRVLPDKITHLYISGAITVQSVKYIGQKPVRKLREFYFQQISGHLRRIESHFDGIIWGIGHDGTAWVSTGGYNGPNGNAIDGVGGEINTVTDFKTVEIYENQRWNPVAGFSSVGLPTDRPPWSDITGRIRLDKADTVLPSIHYQWLSDWIVDQDVPGGTDAEGWQYAVDFPASYHSNKTIFDYVRRRKWIKKCKITIEGPWKCQGFSQLKDVSIKPGPHDQTEIPLWAITSTGDLVYRKGVTPTSPLGSEWERVVTEHPIISVSAGRRNQLWCVSKDGSPMLRAGINKISPTGKNWFYVEKPVGGTFKKIGVGDEAVWALDEQGNLYLRREILPAFPEGTSWQLVDSKVLDFSVGPDDQVWAILSDVEVPGSNLTTLTRRVGVGPSNPCGSGWETGVGALKTTVDKQRISSSS